MKVKDILFDVCYFFLTSFYIAPWRQLIEVICCLSCSSLKSPHGLNEQLKQLWSFSGSGVVVCKIVERWSEISDVVGNRLSLAVNWKDLQMLKSCMILTLWQPAICLPILLLLQLPVQWSPPIKIRQWGASRSTSHKTARFYDGGGSLNQRFFSRMTCAQFWLEAVVTCGLGQMAAEWQHSPAQQYFCSTDWSVISGVEGGVFSSQSSLFDPRRSLQVDHGRSSSRLIRCLSYLAAQCRDAAHLSPPCTFLSAHARPIPLHLWAVGCPHLTPPHPTLSLSFECMASMWCLHLPPWTSHQSPNSVNMRQAAASTLLALTAWPVCPAASAPAAQDVDVELRQSSLEQAVDGFPPFSLFLSFLKLFVPRRNDAWPTVWPGWEINCFHPLVTATCR